MSFQATSYLRKATGRAKSDVANKLVSMFLHEISRKICTALNLTVNDPSYIEAVIKKFGENCCYCGKQLESDRVAMEHLDGMNRFRAGLHIPGNVLLSCKKCNNEKRRDDQRQVLSLAQSGWESFLSHDSSRCDSGCNSCDYWKSVCHDDVSLSVAKLKETRARIAEFREEYARSIDFSVRAQPLLHLELEKIYRECQTFATTRIQGSVKNVISKLTI